MALPYHDSLSSIFLALFALENQSNKEPVKSITERYIKNKPSTILAVLGAHYDRQMQEITKMATIRTENTHSASLPDQIQRSEVLLRNKHGSHWPRISSQSPYFTGWHILLNRNETEVLQNTSTEQRDEKERLFPQNPAEKWNKLSPEHWGAEKLKGNLVRLLPG